MDYLFMQWRPVVQLLLEINKELSDRSTSAVDYLIKTRHVALLSKSSNHVGENKK